jgi:ABC-type transport system substrate-binding protein
MAGLRDGSNGRARRARSTRGVATALVLALGLGAAWAASIGTTVAGAGSGAAPLRMPYDLAAFGGVKFDPTTPSNPNDWYMQRWLYDSLLHQEADGSYTPALAKSATVKDPQTVEIELRPGLKFSDGSPLDAEAVKFSLERTIGAKNVGSVRAEMNEISSITVNSPTSLTIALKTPIAGQFYNLLAHGETYIVSPTAVRSGTPLDQKPVGAGPYLLDSFTPENRAVFVRNPNYYDKKRIKIPRIELVQSASTDPQNAINSLLDNATDAYLLGGIAGSEALTQAGIKVDIKPTDNTAIYAALCKSKPPFDNVKVRQAINYAVDRDVINQLVYQGKSEPMWGHWTKASAFFNPKLDGIYDHNVKKAKALLKEAGAENLTFDMYSNLSADTTRVGEIIKQQMAEAGITVNLLNTTNIVQDFFTDQKAPSSLIPLRRAGLDKVTRNLTPGSIGNTCGYDDPKLNEYVAKLREIDAGSPEYVKTWQEMDKYIVDNALHLFLVWSPAVNAYNPDVIGKISYHPDVLGTARLDVWKTTTKAG